MIAHRFAQFWRAGAVVSGLLVFILAMQWPSWTAFELDLLAEEAKFTVGGDQHQLILGAQPAIGYISIEGVDSLNTEDEGLAILTQGANKTVRFESSGFDYWTQLPPQWVAPGAESRWRVSPALNTIEVQFRLPPYMNLDLAGIRPFQASALAEGGEVSTVESTASYVSVVGSAEGMEVLLDLPRLREDRPLTQDLHLRKISFLRTGFGGAPESALTSPGELRYSEQPWRSPILLVSGDFLLISNPRQLRCIRLALTPEGKLAMRLTGVARSIRLGPAGGVQNRALTLYQLYFDQPWLDRISIWVSLLAAVGGAAFWWFGYREAWR